MATKKLKTLHPSSSQKESVSSGGTLEPNNSLGESCKVTTDKRKASIRDESPRKKQKGVSKPTGVAVEAVTAKGTKRKAGNEEEIFVKKLKGHSNNAAISKPAEAIPATETPSNKQRSGDNVADTCTKTGEPTKASVENVKETGNKKEDGAEQLPAPERPGTTVTEGGRDLSQSSSSPSTSTQENRSTTIYFKTSRADFEAKYLHPENLGEGGFGSVYAGIRKTDNLPVAIKHIAKRYVTCQPVVLHGKIYNIPMEVLLMLRAAGGPRSVGKSSAVTLVDWYDLNQETLLVMERPAPSVDLLTYMLNNNGPMDENTVKVCGHIFLGRVGYSSF
uniref:non-specific serine/threonine protein kinase n=1 Tax=Lates calcarifer TaxID=8187 RepID=A0A4W6DW17_LATCA